MAKAKRRGAFETTAQTAGRRDHYDSDGGTVGSWIRDRGVRETIESVLIAIMLALLFRCFEAEAFIIPTGSMATSLQGEHIDVACEKCGYRYRAGASNEERYQEFVVSTFCPICQYNMQLRRDRRLGDYTKDHETFDGDRILANKFIYDFVDPRRWDVIIFKNPNNPKQNYIKRCVGLPNEVVLIENGDIYTYDLDGNISQKKLQRKPPKKLWHMLQLVDDTDYIAADLKTVGWPLRWNQHDVDDSKKKWKVDYSSDKPVYSMDAGKQTAWLRYRHLTPRWYEWEPFILSGKLPPRIKAGDDGELISDYYAYNQKQGSGRKEDKKVIPTTPPANIDFEDFQMSTMDYENTLGRFWIADMGLHWVGDLCVDADVKVESDSGTLTLDLVEGGAHFECAIDISSGKATLSCSDSNVTFVDQDDQKLDSPPAGQTQIRGPGKYHIRYANCDDRLVLWINKKPIKFGKLKFQNYQRSGKVFPKWSPADSGDAEPVGIGATDIAMTINRLRVYRDIYYIGATNNRGRQIHQQQNRFGEYANAHLPDEIREILTTPRQWGSPDGIALFDDRAPEDDPSIFKIGKDQYMPMGDNSPQSLDARLWDGPPYVEKDLLSGRAILIYWPHSLNWPPFFPNFKRMGFIH